MLPYEFQLLQSFCSSSRNQVLHGLPKHTRNIVHLILLRGTETIPYYRRLAILRPITAVVRHALLRHVTDQKLTQRERRALRFYRAEVEDSEGAERAVSHGALASMPVA